MKRSHKQKINLRTKTLVQGPHSLCHCTVSTGTQAYKSCHACTRTSSCSWHSIRSDLQYTRFDRTRLRWHRGCMQVSHNGHSGLPVQSTASLWPQSTLLRTQQVRITNIFFKIKLFVFWIFWSYDTTRPDNDTNCLCLFTEPWNMIMYTPVIFCSK